MAFDVCDREPLVRVVRFCRGGKFEGLVVTRRCSGCSIDLVFDSGGWEASFPTFWRTA